MQTEYEATFTNIDKNAIRNRLRSLGVLMVKKEFKQRRMVFDLPKGHEIPGGWLRVRDESDVITMSLKAVDGDTIESQKEICLTVDDFQSAVDLLQAIGCEYKAFQESKRELWKLDEVEIMIDEWPFLEPFVEIEGPSEASVKKVATKIGFDYSKALFCSVDTLYSITYGISTEEINNKTPKLIFDMDNPFIKKSEE